VIGFAAALFLGFHASDEKYETVIAGALFLAGASMLIGVLLGFVFGIPRSLQQDGDGKPVEPGSAPARYRENTNLEQISDWLTKILIGISLTQFTQILDLIGKYATAFGPLFHATNGAAIAASIIVYFVVGGFLFGYLWTRIFMAGELQKAQAVTQAELRNLEKQREQQADLDADALGLVDQYLRSGPQPDHIDVQAVKQAIMRASSPVRVQILMAAQEIRSNNWKSNKTLMERTIPVFEALIAAEPDRFHRNYGQLGFALKDKKDPDWAGAEKILSKAIDLRGPPESSGWLLYEFNRAISRIHLDPAFSAKKPSAADMRTKIEEDLRVGGRAIDLKNIPVVVEWAEINGVAMTSVDTYRSPDSPPP
jgi:hypothetical protein